MHRTFLFLLIAGLSLALTIHTLVEPHGWRRRSQIAAEVLTRTSENDALEDRVMLLRGEVNALSRRADSQEHAVRDELGWVRPGDLVIYFEP